MKKRGKKRGYKVKRNWIFGISLALLIMFLIFREASFLYKIAASIALLVAFYLIDYRFDLDFKTHHYVFIIIISVASLLLWSVYFVSPYYDKVLHFLQPILFSSIIFYMVSKLNIKLKWQLVFTFFIVFSIVGIFEIVEYGLDQVTELKLQGVFQKQTEGVTGAQNTTNLIQPPIDDTMIDMLLGLLGALLYAIIKAFSLRKPN